MGVFRKLGNWQTESILSYFNKVFRVFLTFQCLICPRKIFGLFKGILLQIISRNEKVYSFYSHRFEGSKRKIICLTIDKNFEIKLV